VFPVRYGLDVYILVRGNATPLTFCLSLEDHFPTLYPFSKVRRPDNEWVLTRNLQSRKSFQPQLQDVAPHTELPLSLLSSSGLNLPRTQY
jgi:hypothetical protein